MSVVYGRQQEVTQPDVVLTELSREISSVCTSNTPRDAPDTGAGSGTELTVSGAG